MPFLPPSIQSTQLDRIGWRWCSQTWFMSHRFRPLPGSPRSQIPKKPQSQGQSCDSCLAGATTLAVYPKPLLEKATWSSSWPVQPVPTTHWEWAKRECVRSQSWYWSIAQGHMTRTCYLAPILDGSWWSDKLCGAIIPWHKRIWLIFTLHVHMSSQKSVAHREEHQSTSNTKLHFVSMFTIRTSLSASFVIASISNFVTNVEDSNLES